MDLKLRSGKVVALVGESGSGKSTVARMLARLHTQTSGDVRLQGELVTAKHGRAFRRYTHRVQMIFQDPFASLNPVHTVRYVLTRSLRIHHPELHGAALETALRELVQRVQLNPIDSSTSSPMNSPAGSASASRSRARSPPTRRCCSRTSRSRCWTCPSASAC